LPATGLLVDYPKGYFIRPSGDTSKKGVLPDIPVKADRLSAGDEILDAALKKAKAL
jgi:C-terminal processing protease CtpA/Prc